MYRPSHEPPLWWERWLSMPGCVWAAVWSLCCAVQIAVDPFIPRALFSISLGHQPPVIALTIGGVMGAGSALALVGLLTQMQNRSRAWNIERAGWWLTAAAWCAYTIAVMFVFPGSVISWGSSLMLAMVGLTRIVALSLIERDAVRLREAVHTGQVEVVAHE